MRVSIPLPRRCERRTLPIELIPHIMTLAKLTGVGFEPTPPERLVPKTSALDHSANQSTTNGIELFQKVFQNLKLYLLLGD